MGAAGSEATYLVGAARVDITPPLTVPYLGYVQGGRHRFFTGVHDPLYARATVVGAGPERVALVSADAIGLHNGLLGPERNFTAEVRRRVQELCDLPADRLMVAATHAHSTPETIGFRSLRNHPGVAAWLEVLVDQLASAVVQAEAACRPARLQYATGQVQGISVWRRAYLAPPNTPDPTDPEVTVLRFVPEEEGQEVALVHFACHPVTVQVQPLVSADFPGAACALVESAGIGCEHCQFLQGADGDVNPQRGAGGFADVAVYGRVLAEQVTELLGRMAAGDYHTVSGPVGMETESLLLPSRPLPALETLEEEQAAAAERLAATVTDEERQQAAAALALFEERGERVRLGNAPLEAEVQALRLGEVALVGMPGEPFSEMGRALRSLPGPACTRCVGYANGYLGYLAPPEEWARGGYEIDVGMWSLVGPEAYERLLEAGARVVGRLFGEGTQRAG